MPEAPSLRSALSENSLNRIRSWENSLQDALKYLHLRDYFVRLQEEEISYAIGNQKQFINVGHNAQQGLIEAALIAFYQVFASGHAGVGFASNLDEEIRSVRERMKAYVLEQLSWTNNKYSDIFNKLKRTRHSLTAHYDGEAANFSRPSPALVVFAMRGVFLSNTECAAFLSLTSKMAEFVHKVLYKDLLTS